MSAPKACAYCGGTQIDLEILAETAVPSCRQCGAVGPITAGQSEAEAWALWNRRAGACADACPCVFEEDPSLPGPARA